MDQGAQAMRDPLIEWRTPPDGTLLSTSAVSTRLVDVPAPMSAIYAEARFRLHHGRRVLSSRRAAKIGKAELFQDALPTPEAAVLLEEASPLQNQSMVRLTGYLELGTPMSPTNAFSTAWSHASSTKTASMAWSRRRQPAWTVKAVGTSRVVSESPAERGLYRSTASLQNEATQQRACPPLFTSNALTELLCCF